MPNAMTCCSSTLSIFAVLLASVIAAVDNEHVNGTILTITSNINNVIISALDSVVAVRFFLAMTFSMNTRDHVALSSGALVHGMRRANLGEIVRGGSIVDILHRNF
jgi:hypothetical protein